MFRIKKILILLSVFFVISCHSGENLNITIELHNNWEFKQSDSLIWKTAEVPGCNHTDLLKHNIIKDPFVGSNEKGVQWVETKDWEYKCNFDLQKSILNKDNVEVIFEGLDTYAKVFLNDSLILQSDNMFIRHSIDCKSLLKHKNNELHLVFKSPIIEEKIKWEDYPYDLPGGQKVMTRKAGFHYGWDWGARMVSSGIWKPVKIHAWNSVKINSVKISTNEITSKYALLSASIDTKTTSKGYYTFLIKYKEHILNKQRIQLEEGQQIIDLKFDIENPKLWWTNGLGDAFLYVFKFEIRKQNKLIDTSSVRYGIRTIELIQEPDKFGKSFYFKLNGVPAFMKGANYIPQDNFQNRVSKEHYNQLINTAIKSNMNMLRVWGGGIYEDDYFYDLCDENGILVWQDFMFACAMYPANNEFLKSVETEVLQTIKRLRNHPSIALWCGNNEIDEAWHNWGWSDVFSKKDSTEIWNGYQKLFQQIIPNAIKEHDPSRPYVSSSPIYGRGNPKSQFEGDSHYWGVWHDAEPFENYELKVPRFMSEFGFQSFPELNTILKFAKHEDLSIDSETMSSHQKHPGGNSLINKYLNKYYIGPKDFEEFIYLSQLLQAEGIKLGIEAHRRAMPYCGGTLYWQLNDCWPVVSWSSVDYYGNWKALQYFVKKAYNDVIISIEGKDDKTEIYVISDKLLTVEVKLNLKIVDFKGIVKWSDVKYIDLEDNMSNVYYTLYEEDISTIDRKNCVLISQIENQDSILYRSFHYFEKVSNLNLIESDIKIIINKEKRSYNLIISSENLVKNIYLKSNVDGFFEDNFFDIEAYENRKVRFIPTKEISLDSISFNCLSLNRIF